MAGGGPLMVGFQTIGQHASLCGWEALGASRKAGTGLYRQDGQHWKLRLSHFWVDTVRRTSSQDWRAGGQASRTGGQGGLRGGPWQISWRLSSLLWMPLYVAGKRQGQAGEMARDSTDRRANTGKSDDYERQLWVIFGSS